jgi:DNA-binding protein H-NS
VWSVGKISISGQEIIMAKVNLTGMNVEALMNLRNQIDKRLLEYRAELEKQLEALSGQPKRKASSGLKGKKVPPKYRSRSGETWAGRGVRPKWMVAALKKGKKIEDFLIERRRITRS